MSHMFLKQLLILWNYVFLFGLFFWGGGVVRHFLFSDKHNVIILRPIYFIYFDLYLLNLRRLSPWNNKVSIHCSLYPALYPHRSEFSNALTIKKKSSIWMLRPNGFLSSGLWMYIWTSWLQQTLRIPGVSDSDNILLWITVKTEFYIIWQYPVCPQWCNFF